MPGPSLRLSQSLVDAERTPMGSKPSVPRRLIHGAVPPTQGGVQWLTCHAHVVPTLCFFFAWSGSRGTNRRGKRRTGHDPCVGCCLFVGMYFLQIYVLFSKLALENGL